VQEKRGRAEDAIRVANLAVSLAKTAEDHADAEESLAGAKQFEISQNKMKEPQEAQASAQVAPQKKPDVDNEGCEPSLDNQGSKFGPLDVLSDTMGVDFGPYLARVLHDVKKNWYNLIPEQARPPIMKKGKTSIAFAILKNGRITGMRLERCGISGDAALDRAAWGGITASDPFPPLPSEFGGQYLSLRLHFYYNPH
jgi:outer membrane biosynthesis protein TonB